MAVMYGQYKTNEGERRKEHRAPTNLLRYQNLLMLQALLTTMYAYNMYANISKHEDAVHPMLQNVYSSHLSLVMHAA